MEKNPQQTLEELIHRELSKLPARQAPESLIPRVLAQIQARSQKRWWQRPWSHWPFALQLASVPILLASAASAVFGLSYVWSLVSTKLTLDPLWEMAGSLSDVWDFVAVLGNAVLLLAQSAGEGWLWAALFVPVAMYLACVGFGTLCYRMAVSHR